jgi:hypothetical protein
MLWDDPDFEQKAADVIGLYINPPDDPAASTTPPPAERIYCNALRREIRHS